MKRMLFCVFVFLTVFFMTGCMNSGKDDVLKNLSKKINDSKGYYLTGQMEIINNEESYKYDVDVSFSKEDNFKVSLKNQTNNHQQIILRNSDGVYVLTPSLNKSFKFQSDWPYNNSQSYLLQMIISDIENDDEYNIAENDGGYIITSKVNYSNNQSLVKQKVYIDKNVNINKVEVLDNNDVVKIKVTFSTIDLNSTFDSDYFKLENCMKSASIEDESVTVGNIEEIIFPMHIPEDTYLSAQEKVYVESGERVILTFTGAKPFVLVQETVRVGDELVIPTSGEPLMILDTIGSISDSSVNWVSNGIEYYISSNVLSKPELLDVANSLSVMPVGK
ncbi:MAG: outer membrane lipoprotein carrier protein LolA [Firmicutes bacterium]|nr:outer membrane lipoprotein carrier protein LolA [Bacillota bacterium]